MSKNLTRKGLALGAVVALGTTLFAGAPAHAAAGLTVAPKSGTGYTVLASDTFTVKAYGNADYTLGSNSAFRWKITRPSVSASATYTPYDGATASSALTAGSGSTTTVDILTQTSSATSGATALKIAPSITTASSEDWIVQAYLEADNSNGLTAGDTVVSAPVTIHFVNNLTSTATLDQVVASTNITGTVKYSSADFNYAQSTLGNTHIWWIKDGATWTDGGAVTLNTDENGFEFSANASVAASSVIGAKAKTVAYSGATAAYTSTAVYSTATAASAATGVDTTYTRSENVRIDGTPTVTGSSNSGTIHVRKGTKSFTYRVDFNKSDVALAAGKPVAVVITESGSTISTGDVVRVNGKKLTGGNASGETATLNTVTDATGGLTITVESDLAAEDDEFTVAVTSNSKTSTQTIKYVAAVIAAGSLVDANAPLGSTTRTVVRGSSATINYELVDQFGKPWTKADTAYRVSFASTNSVTVPAAAAYFTSGKASASLTVDSLVAAGEDVLTATLQESVSGGAYANVSGTITATSKFNVVTSAQAATTLTLKDATLSATTGTVVSKDDSTALVAVDKANATLSAIDRRVNPNSAAPFAITDDYGTIVNGVLQNVDGSFAAGVSVTISGPGLFFSTEKTGATYVSAGSITVNTDQLGAYKVFVFANKGGTLTATVTAGSLSKTQSLKFKPAASTAGKAIAITAPSTSLAGRSVDVVIALTDKYGAPVQTKTAEVPRIAVSVTGPGSYTAIAADTDATGKITFKLIFGSNDNGTAVIKATYDVEDDGVAEVTTSQSIVVGATPAAAATAAVAGSTGKFYVSATAAAGKSVVVKVAGKFVTSFKATGSKKTVAVKSSKGSKKVTVYVGGKLTATKTVTVK